MNSQTTSRVFEMGACIGRGGFGDVYRATMISQAGLRSDVAVKTLNSTVTQQHDAIARLADEARMLSMLRHRAVLRVHDLVMLGNRPALVTEYLDGADLSAILSRNPRGLPFRVALHIVSEVAAALYAAYSSLIPGQQSKMRIVHRDIKPANIRVLPDGGIRVMDFGIARSNDMERSANTGTGLIVGTWGYLAPERVGGEIIEAPSDVYALGCVLFECLSGTQVFQGLSQRDMARLAVVEEEHVDYIDQRLELVQDRVPDDLFQLLLSMLDFKSEYRPRSQDVEVSLDQMYDAYAGENMRTWCRKQPWPDPRELAGAMGGQVIEETTLITPGASSSLRSQSAQTMSMDPPPATPRRGGVGWLAAAVGVVLVVLAAALGVLAVGGVGAAVWWTTPAAEPGEAAVQQTANEAVAEPIIDESNTPSATPDPSEAIPEPVTPEVQPPRRARKPEVSTPQPARAAPPAAQPASAPSATGTVTFSGGDALQLRDSKGTHEPGDVPPGVYELWAGFDGHEPVLAGELDVKAGDALHVTCSAAMSLCRATRN